MYIDEQEEYLKKGISKAQFLCSKQEKCISEIIKKLYDWKIPSSLHEDVIKSLLEDKFIDEERFVGFYVKDKFRFNRWGKIKIAYNLRQKNINPSVINLHLSKINEQEYIDTLKDLMSAKLKSVNEIDKYKLKAKIFRHLQSKGFETDIIINIYENLIDDNEK